MRKNLTELGSSISVRITPDAKGFVGRECPQSECLGYFKIKTGTGLTGKNLPCHCPYCGHTQGHNAFWTKEQIEYARSVARNELIGAIRQEFKDLARDINSRGSWVRMEHREGPLPPVRYYREKQLETDIICDTCKLEYAVYGVFAYCPDCRKHNSWQILDKNLELAAKEVMLSATVESDLASHLVGDALENAVSAFDGFGRELCRVHAARSTNGAKAKAMSFQNLAGAQSNINALFGFDMALGVSSSDWTFALRCFQKRHLLAHSMGVVDDKYIQATGDSQAVAGRKVVIRAEDVSALVTLLRMLGAVLETNLAKLQDTYAQ